MPTLKDDSLMPFGKHRGTKMANVPASYLLYIYEQPWIKGNLEQYIFENLDVLKKEVEENANKARK